MVLLHQLLPRPIGVGIAESPAGLDIIANPPTHPQAGEAIYAVLGVCKTADYMSAVTARFTRGFGMCDYFLYMVFVPCFCVANSTKTPIFEKVEKRGASTDKSCAHRRPRKDGVAHSPKLTAIARRPC